MGSPIILPDTSGLAQGITQVGGILGNAIMQSQQQKQKQRSQSLLEDMLNDPTVLEPANLPKLLIAAQNAGVDGSVLFKALQDAKPKPFQQLLKAKNYLSPRQGTPSDLVEDAIVKESDKIPGQYPDSPPPYANPKMEGLPFNDLSNQELTALIASGDKQSAAFAQTVLDMRKEKRTDYYQDRDFVYKKNKTFNDQLTKTREVLPEMRDAVENMRFAIENNQTPSWDRFASFVPIYGRALLSPEGQLLQSANKTFLLSDLQKISGPKNQFLERTVINALANPSQSREAQDILITTLEGRIELEEAKVAIATELENEAEAQGLEVVRNKEKKVNERLKPVAQKIRENTVYRLRELQEQSKGLDSLVNKKPAKGTPLTFLMLNEFIDKYGENAIKQAKKFGYEVKPLEFYQQQREMFLEEDAL